MTKHKKFALKIYQCKSAILPLILATILMTGLNPAGALAQCESSQLRAPGKIR
jgi:hypothetical protein